MKTLLIAVVLLCFTLLDVSAGKKRVDFKKTDTVGTVITGTVSYYGDYFHGRGTASGEKFDMNAMTAASKTLPFDSYIRVTHEIKRKDTTIYKSVIVRINDRGPYAKKKHNTKLRVLDLSKAAARKIGVALATVKMELLKVGKNHFKRDVYIELDTAFIEKYLQVKFKDAE